MSYISFSSGLREMRGLPRILGVDSVKHPLNRSSQDKASVLVWGRRPLSRMGASTFSEVLAKSFGYPIIRLEDSFIRSYAPDSLSMGVVLDRTGLHYDSCQESDLENIILNTELQGDSLLRTKRLIHEIVSSKLSKYNDNVPLSTELPERYILVFEQVYEDASVAGGQADKATFKAMLDAALSHPSGLPVVVKTHPVKKGYFNSADLADCLVLNEKVSPYDLFPGAEEVYVVSSQVGFEALMAGKSVTCFGAPFYSGWGVTEDKVKISRRDKCKSVEEIFHSAYLEYSHYFNPYTGDLMELEDVLTLIKLQRKKNALLSGDWSAEGITSWKRSFFPTFFGKDSNVSFRKKSKGRKVIWAGKRPPNWSGWSIEDGFVRSKGLGGEFVAPFSLAIDKKGIYFDSSTPSDLEEMLQLGPALTPEQNKESREVLEILRNKNLTKYNLPGNVGRLELLKEKVPMNGRVILVVGQVEKDASIRCGSPFVKNDQELLSLVNRSKKEGDFILYKPHPEIINGVRKNDNIVIKKDFDVLIDDIGIAELFPLVDEVHTITSLSGMEALIHGKHVVTYGQPFYSGWGLTEDKFPVDRRDRKLSLEALFYWSYLEYPVYVSLKDKEICDLKTVISLLSGGVEQNFSHFIKNVFRRTAFLTYSYWR